MDRLSSMHGGGLLPQIHALQIFFVGSHGLTGGDGRSGGSGGCLVLECNDWVIGDSAVVVAKEVKKNNHVVRKLEKRQ
ncbi:hypothetical protein GBA52_025087 [Prunus armeniaca]|nr:hypothetical protein GBA52_025087 [Prunus armeniaca]